MQKKYWVVAGIMAFLVFLVTFGFVLAFQNRTDHNPAVAEAQSAAVEAQSRPQPQQSEIKLSLNAVYIGLLNGLQKGLSTEESASLYNSAALLARNVGKYSKDYQLAAAIAAVTQLWSGDLSGGLRAIYDLRMNVAAASFIPPGSEKRRPNDFESFLLYALAQVYEYRDEPAQAMELYQTLSGFADDRIIYLNGPMFSEAPVALFARLRRAEIFDSKLSLPGAASGELLTLAQKYGYLALPIEYQYANLADYCTEKLLAMNTPSVTSAANALKMLAVAEGGKYPALVFYSALMYARSGAIDQAIDGLRQLEQTYQGAFGVKRNDKTVWGSYEVYSSIAQTLPYSLGKALPIIEKVKAVAGPYLRPYILLWQAKVLANEHALNDQATAILKQLLEETAPADMYDYVKMSGVDPYQEAGELIGNQNHSSHTN